MSVPYRFRVILTAVMALIIAIVPTTALVNADNSARPMMSHDFTDVPVVGKEFMEPYIDAFFHQGVTTGCSVTPPMYCPEDPLTRAAMAVFMGRALGYLDAETDGFSARAYFKQTNTNVSDDGVIGASVNGRGVFGTSTGGPGVSGLSISGPGVLASSTHNMGLMVFSTYNYGTYTFSTNGSGLFAESGGPDNFSDAQYDIVMGGLFGEIYGHIVDIYSNDSVYVELDHDNNVANAFFGVYNGADTLLFSVAENGATTINGDLTINGNYTATGTKSAIVSTVSHGDRLMYAVESTEVWFEDAGSAELVRGVAVVEFDEIFAETVNLGEEYHVFLTPIGGWADLYVEQRSATSFTVRSADGSDVEFSYRIMAKRLGFEDERMEAVEE